MRGINSWPAEPPSRHFYKTIEHVYRHRDGSPENFQQHPHDLNKVGLATHGSLNDCRRASIFTELRSYTEVSANLISLYPSCLEAVSKGTAFEETFERAERDHTSPRHDVHVKSLSNNQHGTLT